MPTGRNADGLNADPVSASRSCHGRVFGRHFSSIQVVELVYYCSSPNGVTGAVNDPATFSLTVRYVPNVTEKSTGI